MVLNIRDEHYQSAVAYGCIGLELGHAKLQHIICNHNVKGKDVELWAAAPVIFSTHFLNYKFYTSLYENFQLPYGSCINLST